MTKSRTTVRVEAAARKFRQAARLENQWPADAREAALNPLHAQRAREEGQALLVPPEHLVGTASTELVPAQEPGEALSTAQEYLLETLEEPNTIGLAASEQRAEVAVRGNVLAPALDAATSAQARNSIERMLCHQLAAVHMAGMELLARVAQAPLMAVPPSEVARLANTAARLFDVYQAGCLTLQKLKSGDRQHVVVQHQQVNVGPGGQAVVAGRLAPSSRRRRRGAHGR